MEYIHLKWYNQNVHNILLSENNFQIISNMQIYQFSQFSHLVMSDCLWLHGLQHARPPCPGVYSNSCPLRWWCYPPILSSVVPFSSHLQSSPAPGSFPMSQFFHIRWPQYWSFSFSISPSNEHSGLISFRMVGSPSSPRDSEEPSPKPQCKSNDSLALSFL